MKPSILGSLLLAACALTAGSWHWQWSRNPEADVVSYRIETHYAEAFHFPCSVCCDDSVPCAKTCNSTCISYNSTPAVLAATEPQPASGDVCTDWDAGGLAGTVTPMLDSVLFVNVRAVDAAGNVGN